MKARYLTILALSGLFWIGAAASATTAPTVAVFKLVSGNVSVQRGEESLLAKVGMPIQQADVISTGVNGKAGLTFEDNSLMSLGPGSRLAIDSFSFNRTTHEGHFESTLSSGRMAVVSGKIAKEKRDAMKVRTPTTLLGVRGTEFIVEAGD